MSEACRGLQMTRGRLFIGLRMRVSIQIKYGVLLKSYAYRREKILSLEERVKREERNSMQAQERMV
jgi:hypothetical protein